MYKYYYELPEKDKINQLKTTIKKDIKMTITEKLALCYRFFYDLGEILMGDYEFVGSCNRDCSEYLIPNGTLEEITYCSKPALSFRISDHWNWYSNIRKNPNPAYIQCWSVDIPSPNPRPEPGKPSKPKVGIQVSVIGGDGKYHVVYGERYDKKRKTWGWLDTNPADIAEMILAQS